MDNLTRKINETGVRAHVYQDDQWSTLARTLRDRYRQNPTHEPLVLIGHSYGADDVVRIARELKKDAIPVELLVTLDAVTPPAIPDNVRHCVNIYQSNGVWDTMPWLRGVAVKPENAQATRLDNFDIRVNRTDLLSKDIDHFNIEKQEQIHREIISYVLDACPPREQWVAAQKVQTLTERQASGTILPPMPAPAKTQDTQTQRLSTGVP
jgi:thioesterase domain-containing protein